MIEFGEKSKFEYRFDCRFERDPSEPKDVSSDSRLTDAHLLVLAKDLYLVIPEGDDDDDEKDDDDDDDSYEVINDCLVTKILIVTFSRSTFLVKTNFSSLNFRNSKFSGS